MSLTTPYRSFPRAHLLKPAPEWESCRWDEEGEHLRSISFATLIERGGPPDAVPDRMNVASSDRILFSDSVWDEQWLFQLFEVTSLMPNFLVRHPSPDCLIKQFAAECSVSNELMGEAVALTARG